MNVGSRVPLLELFGQECLNVPAGQFVEALLSEGRNQMAPKIGTICLNRPWPIVHRESRIGKALRIQLQRYGIEQRHLPRYPASTNELIKRHYGLRLLFAVVDRLQLPLKHLLGDVFWNFTERDETPGAPEGARRTRTGCSTPYCRMLAASSASLVSSKRRRGLVGDGPMWLSGIS